GAGVVIIVILIIWIIYRTIFNHLISNRTYRLSAKVLDQDNQPLPNVKFSVLTRKKKPTLDENMEPLIIKTNEEGVLNVEEFIGGKYLLKNDELDIKYYLYIKRIKDKYFSLKEKSKSEYR